MSLSSHAKDEIPVYAGTPMAAPVARSKGRHVVSTIVKITLALAVVIYCISLIRHSEQDQQSFNRLESEYNAAVDQQKDSVANAAVARRALVSSSATYITTTTTATTVTQGTTVTFEVTASSSSIPSASPSSSGSYNTTLSASGACGTGPAQTVTVTVTAKPTISIESTAPEASFSSSLAPVTVVETRVTTATVTVTASTPKLQTQTLTATATEDQTATQIITIHPTAGTSTSTADAIFGTGSHTIRYPNSTISLTPYGTANGGSLLSTASYTLTVPGGHTGGAVATPVHTTSQVDPLSTIVTVSGANKMSSALTSTAMFVFAAVIFPLLV